MNVYEVEYYVEGAGRCKEIIQSSSEYNARELVKSKFSGSVVRIIHVRMTEFAGGHNR